MSGGVRIGIPARALHRAVARTGGEAAAIRLRGRALSVFGLCAALAACAPGAAVLLETPPAAPRTETVHVFKGGWHTGFVLARRDVAADRIPEIADFPDAAYIEFSWGDRAFYRTPDPGLGAALAAALKPTPAVMHVAAFALPPGEAPPWREALRVPLSRAELERLVAAIADSFDRPRAGRSERLESGLYGRSGFYAATGRFHLFNTCNTWVARQLEAAGIGIAPDGVLTADDLMDRLRALPRVAAPAG